MRFRGEAHIRGVTASLVTASLVTASLVTAGLVTAGLVAGLAGCGGLSAPEVGGLPFLPAAEDDEEPELDPADFTPAELIAAYEAYLDRLEAEDARRGDGGVPLAPEEPEKWEPPEVGDLRCFSFADSGDLVELDLRSGAVSATGHAVGRPVDLLSLAHVGDHVVGCSADGVSAELFALHLGTGEVTTYPPLTVSDGPALPCRDVAAWGGGLLVGLQPPQSQQTLLAVFPAGVSGLALAPASVLTVPDMARSLAVVDDWLYHRQYPGPHVASHQLAPVVASGPSVPIDGADADARFRGIAISDDGQIVTIDDNGVLSRSDLATGETSGRFLIDSSLNGLLCERGATPLGL